MTAVAESSNSLYTGCIELMKGAEVDPMDHKATIEWITTTKKALSTQKNYLCSVQYWLRGRKDAEEACKEYRKKIKELADLITEGYKTQTLTVRESKKYETWDKICEYRDKILADVSVLDTDKILVSLYTLLPPVRLDYANLRLYDKKPEEDKGNYAVVNKTEAFVRLNDHKTAKTYGALEMKLPKTLARRIRLFMKANPAVTVLYEMTEKTFSKRVQRLFSKYTDKSIGVSVLRHSYISNFLDTAPSLKKCEALAKVMGHSPTLQQYYRRLRKEGDISSSESDTETDEE